MTQFCDFDRDGEYLRCTACGRTVRSSSDARILAKCRDFSGTVPPVAHAKRDTGGPGTELKRLLAGWPLYVKTSPGCSCNRHAAQMDAWGCDGCEQRIDEIAGWLREEATKRRIPFVDAAGRLLVRRAIKKARGKMGKHT